MWASLEKASFADCNYVDIGKVQNYADIIYGWSPTKNSYPKRILLDIHSSAVCKLGYAMREVLPIIFVRNES